MAKSATVVWWPDADTPVSLQGEHVRADWVPTEVPARKLVDLLWFIYIYNRYADVLSWIHP